MLYAAYWRVFLDKIPAKDEFSRFLEEIYAHEEKEDPITDAEKVLDTIFDEIVQLQSRTYIRLPLRKIVYGIKFGQKQNENDMEDLTKDEKSEA
jgi:hypothetical protein